MEADFDIDDYEQEIVPNYKMIFVTIFIAIAGFLYLRYSKKKPGDNNQNQNETSSTNQQQNANQNNNENKSVESRVESRPQEIPNNNNQHQEATVANADELRLRRLAWLSNASANSTQTPTQQQQQTQQDVVMSTSPLKRQREDPAFEERLKKLSVSPTTNHQNEQANNNNGKSEMIVDKQKPQQPSSETNKNQSNPVSIPLATSSISINKAHANASSESLSGTPPNARNNQNLTTQMSSSPMKSPSSSTSIPNSQQHHSEHFSLHQLLQKGFNVALEQSRLSDSSKPILLDQLASDLAKDNNRANFIQQDIDVILIELSMKFENNAVSFAHHLVQSFARFQSFILKKSYDGISNVNEIYEHCFRAITTHFFMTCQENANVLLPLLESNEPTTSIPELLLEKMSLQSTPDEFSAVIKPCVDELFRKMKAMNFSTVDFAPYRALRKLVNVPAANKVIVSSPNFNPKLAVGRLVSSQTILGTFVAPSPENPLIQAQYFPDVQNLTQNHVNSTFSSIRLSTNAIANACQAILTAMCREKVREEVLDWIASTINANKARSKQQYDHAMVASEGFMINFCSILLKLCAPFTNTSDLNQQFPKVNVFSLVNNQRLPIGEETRLAFSLKEATDWLSTVSDSEKKKQSFVTDIFYFANFGLHCGIVSAVVFYKNLARGISHLKDQLDRLKATRAQWGSTMQAFQMEQQLKQKEMQFDAYIRMKLCLDAQLLDPQLIQDVLGFYSFSAQWLLNLVKSHSEQGMEQNLPPQYAALPEFFIGDITEYLLFVLRVAPKHVDVGWLQPLVISLITIMGDVKYLRNPYVRGQLAEILRLMFPEEGPTSPFLTLFENPVVLKTLLPALIQLYVDIESTGRHAQFGEKFGVRRDISILLKHLRGMPIYQNSLKQFSTQHPQLFIRFVNMILNDSHYLLDEVLTNLPKIRETELEMKDTAHWMAQPEATRTEREDYLKQICGSVESCSILSMETINLLLFLTDSVVEAFMVDSLVGRVAEMLNYYLNNLVGPKSQNLKVENPERFKFDARTLLSVIIRIYNNCSTRKEFISVVVEEGRSFTVDSIERAVSILERNKFVSNDVLEKFKDFTKRAEQAAKETQKEDEDLGEIPDDYQDPITMALMADPVILPSSGKTVERKVIERILLTDPKDPFNRQPLTIDLVKPNDELRQQIEKWKSEQLKNKNKK